jgi:hypothetical protein
MAHQFQPEGEDVEFNFSPNLDHGVCHEQLDKVASDDVHYARRTVQRDVNELTDLRRKAFCDPSRNSSSQSLEIIDMVRFHDATLVLNGVEYQQTSPGIFDFLNDPQFTDIKRSIGQPEKGLPLSRVDQIFLSTSVNDDVPIRIRRSNGNPYDYLVPCKSFPLGFNHPTVKLVFQSANRDTDEPFEIGFMVNGKSVGSMTIQQRGCITFRSLSNRHHGVQNGYLNAQQNRSSWNLSRVDSLRFILPRDYRGSLIVTQHYLEIVHPLTRIPRFAN